MGISKPKPLDTDVAAAEFAALAAARFAVLAASCFYFGENF